MAARNDPLKDRLSRYQEINISVTGRKSGRIISIPVWFDWRAASFTFCRCRGRIHSGTRTCTRSRRSGSMWARQRLNQKLLLLLMPHRCRPWSRNFEPSTGQRREEVLFKVRRCRCRPHAQIVSGTGSGIAKDDSEC